MLNSSVNPSYIHTALCMRIFNWCNYRLRLECSFLSKQGVDSLPHLYITWILGLVNLEVQLSTKSDFEFHLYLLPVAFKIMLQNCTNTKSTEKRWECIAMYMLWCKSNRPLLHFSDSWEHRSMLQEWSQVMVHVQPQELTDTATYWLHASEQVCCRWRWRSYKMYLQNTTCAQSQL